MSTAWLPLTVLNIMNASKSQPAPLPQSQDLSWDELRIKVELVHHTDMRDPGMTVQQTGARYALMGQAPDDVNEFGATKLAVKAVRMLLEYRNEIGHKHG